MQRRRGASRILALSLSLCAVELFAWDDGFMTLTTPSRAESPLMFQLDFQHRFLQLFPLHGANALLGVGAVFFDTSRAQAYYQTKEEEFTGELSVWRAIGGLRAGVGVEMNAGSGIGAPAGVPAVSWAGTVFASAPLVSEVLTMAANLQYDTGYSNLNFGVGLGLGIPRLPFSLLLEGSGGFPADEAPVYFWSAGFLVKTAGHQFILYGGNGNDLRMRTLAGAGLGAKDELTFGFVIRRKLDVYFD